MLKFCFQILMVIAIASAATAGDLSVKDAWIRQPPPGANAAAFMTLVNSGTTVRRVVSVSTEAAKHSALHQSLVKDGVATMMHVPALDVPAGGSAKLEPGGYHIMLIRLKLPGVGMTISLTLELDKGESLVIPVEIRASGPGAGGDHSHH